MVVVDAEPQTGIIVKIRLSQEDMDPTLCAHQNRQAAKTARIDLSQAQLFVGPLVMREKTLFFGKIYCVVQSKVERDFFRADGDLITEFSFKPDDEIIYPHGEENDMENVLYTDTHLELRNGREDFIAAFLTP